MKVNKSDFSVECVVVRDRKGNLFLWSPSSAAFDLEFQALSEKYDTKGYSTDGTMEQILDDINCLLKLKEG